MKKALLFTLLFALMGNLNACNSEKQTDENQQNGGSEVEDNNTADNTGNYLVLYCSRSGNTEQIAQAISTTLDCSIIEVQPETPYDDNYNTMLTRAREEQAAIASGNYPAITTSVDSFDEYDIIFVGYPIWYARMATPMQTFLHNHADKLAGKCIALFATSGSSSISTSVSEAQTLCPNASFSEPFHLTSATLHQLANRLPIWLEELECVDGD